MFASLLGSSDSFLAAPTSVHGAPAAARSMVHDFFASPVRTSTRRGAVGRTKSLRIHSDGVVRSPENVSLTR